MTPLGRWTSGLLIVAVPAVALGILRPLFHRPEGTPPVVTQRELSAALKFGLPHPEASPDIAASAKGPVSAPTLRAQSPRDRAIERWRQNSPSSVLPYDLDGGGPRPGLPMQNLGGFALSAQASDAPNPLGLTPAPPADKHRPVITYLTVTTSQPIPKMISWELVENGLVAEGEASVGSSVSTASLMPVPPTGLATSIIQSPSLNKNRHPKYVVIHGYLRQAEDYEEPLAFRTPAVGSANQAAQSQETPSGVAVTLSPQAMTSVGGSGDPSILRLSFSVSPSQTPALLPNSPLCRKYHRPVLLRVGVTTPTGNTYDYPFSDLENTASLYKQPNQVWQYGPTPDVLTLVVQQRVYLQDIPFALKVPISHKPIMDHRVSRNP